jgi:hypothetical protein
MNRKWAPLGWQYVAPRSTGLGYLYKDRSKGSPEMSHIMTFFAAVFKNRFGLKNIKITGESSSADEELPHFQQSRSS